MIELEDMAALVKRLHASANMLDEYYDGLGSQTRVIRAAAAALEAADQRIKELEAKQFKHRVHPS